MVPSYQIVPVWSRKLDKKLLAWADDLKKSLTAFQFSCYLFDEATVKTFYKENGHYRLQPQNPTMQPIIANNVTILGRVISSIRYY